MKKIWLSCVLVMTLSVANPYTQVDRILDMQKMAQAMQDIQSGFFYNNLDIVTAGTEDLKKAVGSIRPTSEDQNNTDVYERWMKNNSTMTKRIQRNILQKTEVLLKRFTDGDPIQALQEYNRITRECMKCHISLRKW